MKLTNLFFGEQQPITETNSTSSDFSVSFRLARMLREMVPGQTLQGEIVSKNGNEVQIKLLDDLLFSARLEQNINMLLMFTTFSVLKLDSSRDVRLEQPQNIKPIFVTF